MRFKCLGMNSSWLEWDLSCGRRHEQQWRWGENKTNENAKTQILDAELNWWIFQPTYNYCKFYEPKLVEGVCSFNKDNVIDCAPDAEFTFAPFNMDSSVATENNMVGIFIKIKLAKHPLLVVQYCSQYIWTPTIDSFFMIGLLAGSFIFGVLSDKIGRRHAPWSQSLQPA